MTLELLRDVVSGACLVLGALFCLTAGLGLIRFPDVLTRMHAGTKPQVLGLLLTALGAAVRLGGWAVVGPLLLVVVFQVITAPVSAHMVSRVAYRRRHVRSDLLQVDELAEATAVAGGLAGEPDEDEPTGDEPADAPRDRPRG